MSLRLTLGGFAAAAVLSTSVLVLPAAPAQAREAGIRDAADRASAPSAGHRGPAVVAHRGASGHAPENTLAAVDKAAELGIEWVENDVQRSKDGELVVMHDTTLDRTTDAEELFPDRAPWKVSDFTSEEIAQLDAGSWFGPEYKGEPVPTLREFLERMSTHRQKLLLELKAPENYPGIEGQTLRQLAREGWLDSRHVRRKLIIQSFDAVSVRTVHRLAPAVKTGFLGAPAVEELYAYARFCDQINPSYASVSEEYVDAVHAVRGAHGRPLEVFTWTVNDAGTAILMDEAGVDGLITNYPDVVRDAVEKG